MEQQPQLAAAAEDHGWCPRASAGRSTQRQHLAAGAAAGRGLDPRQSRPGGACAPGRRRRARDAAAPASGDRRGGAPDARPGSRPGSEASTGTGATVAALVSAGRRAGAGVGTGGSVRLSCPCSCAPSRRCCVAQGQRPLLRRAGTRGAYRHWPVAGHRHRDRCQSGCWASASRSRSRCSWPWGPRPTSRSSPRRRAWASCAIWPDLGPHPRLHPAHCTDRPGSLPEGPLMMKVLLVPTTFVALYMRRYGPEYHRAGLALFITAMIAGFIEPNREQGWWLLLAASAGAALAYLLRLAPLRPSAAQRSRSRMLADYRRDADRRSHTAGGATLAPRRASRAAAAGRCHGCAAGPGGGLAAPPRAPSGRQIRAVRATASDCSSRSRSCWRRHRIRTAGADGTAIAAQLATGGRGSARPYRQGRARCGQDDVVRHRPWPGRRSRRGPHRSPMSCSATKCCGAHRGAGAGVRGER